VRERVVYVEKESGGFAPGEGDFAGEAESVYPASAETRLPRVLSLPGDDDYLVLRGAVQIRGIHALRQLPATFVAEESLTARASAAGQSAAAVPG
jgi:hypothetical protein